MKTEKTPDAARARRTSPEGRGLRARRAPRGNPEMSLCSNWKWKCSVNRRIVHLLTFTKPMTEQFKLNTLDTIIKLLVSPNQDSESSTSPNILAEALKILINTSLLAQRDAHIQCEKYERNDKRTGLRNGFKPRTLRSKSGEITVSIPQVRNSQDPFVPFIPGFEQGSRVDRALNLAIAEMYLHGTSTRKVGAVMEQICGGKGVSAAYVSQCTAQLDETFEQWRNRPLPAIAHLYLDATYVKIRQDGAIRDCAVFIATGIHSESGKRLILGVSTGISEASQHWEAFIQNLLDRGMSRPLGVTSDNHPGIRKALASTLTGVPWQRCQFHFQQNAQAHVTKQGYKKTAAAYIRNIFHAPNKQSALKLALETEEIFRRDRQSKLADWIAANIEECLTFADYPIDVQRRLRTSNTMENINRQLKRRTNVISIFPSEASLMRIITAKLMDISDEWEGQTGRIYISPDKFRQINEVQQATTSQEEKLAV